MKNTIEVILALILPLLLNCGPVLNLVLPLPAMEYLFAPFQIFQLLPIAVLVPASLLVIGIFRENPGGRSRPLGLVGSCVVLWIAYGIWEHFVQLWAETETAPIRVDLLLIYPLLAVLSVWSVVAIWRWRKSPESGPD